jgi:hypothetical protein
MGAGGQTHVRLSGTWQPYEAFVTVVHDTQSLLFNIVNGEGDIQPLAAGVALIDNVDIAVSSADEIPVQSVAAQVTFPSPGELVVNSSDGGEVLNVPAHGQTFSSQQDAISWAAANLNARIEYDEQGNAINAYWSSTEIGSFFYVDEATQSLVEVDDVAAALLGGRDGIVTIAGAQYCIRDDGCEAGMAPHALPEESRDCGADELFCIKETSFKRNLLVYKAVGTRLKQVDNGFRITHKFCWKGPIPWSCRVKHGANHLSLTATFQLQLAGEGCGDPFDSAGGNGSCPAGNRSGLTERLEKDNTEQLKLRKGTLFPKLKVWFTPSSVDQVRPGLPPSGGPVVVEGVCASGGGFDPRSQINTQAATQTSIGNVDFVCPNSDIPI